MNKRAVAAVILVAGLLLVSEALDAHSYGHINSTLRPGDVGNGCGGCHGSTPGVVEVEFRGLSAMLPGATARYEVIISNITHPAARAGFTAAIDKKPGKQPVFSNVAGEPTATADSFTQIVNNNASFPLKAPVGNRAVHLIDLTMPASASYGETYTIYTVGEAGWAGTQVGWRHAANFTLTVGPPTPVALVADPIQSTAALISLQWAGSNQGEHFRLLGKTDEHPSDPADPDAFLVYQGPNTAAEASGLSVGTTYHFAVWAQVPDEDIYSAQAATVVATTRADELFRDGFESIGQKLADSAQAQLTGE